MSTVAFIGLGTMGRPMARNLLRAGHRLVVYARRPEAAAELVAAGARQAASPAEAACEAEFVISIVTADAEVSQVALGPGGVIEGAAPGKTFIDMSTIAPETIRRIGARLHEAGMAVLDAPVSGGPAGAEAASLAIMAGGERAEFDRCREVFAALGKHVFHVGSLGAGQTIKLVNQMIGGGIMALIGEGFVLAKAAGADLATMADVVSVSSGGSTLFEARARKYILADRYRAGFTTELMRKDLALALEMGRELRVPLPVAAAAFQQYTAAMNQGHASDDFSSVAKVCEQAAGVQIVAEGRS
ncbi:MAG TPA: NAD(P)-dependent oxidoreductase [Pirellulales bacterium]|jgi:3-hydroxyisobutyrate dehydrogenase-like beta-hydroxyacid dehydrogenase|nr:NAD(P)-dependent oxidoreductase [Pirellulales bacterium]